VNFRRLLLISTLATVPFFNPAEAKTHFYHTSQYTSYHQSTTFSKPSNIHVSSQSTTTFTKPASSTTTATSTPMFSKPTVAASSNTNSTTANTYSFSKPGSSTSTAVKSIAPSSGLANAVTRSQSKSSLAAFTAEQNRYKSTPYASYASPQAARTSPLWQTYGNRYRTTHDYWAARSRFASTQPPLPQYVVDGRPSYGGLSAAFLGGFLLSDIMNPPNALYAYSMQGNPDFDAWRDDMNQQAQTNSDLRAKLAVMNQQIDNLQAQNTAKNTTLPSDVDPAYAMSPSIAVLATTHNSSMGFFAWLGVMSLALIVLAIVFVLVMRWLARKIAA
jgi:hypothetical protein